MPGQGASAQSFPSVNGGAKFRPARTGFSGKGKIGRVHKKPGRTTRHGRVAGETNYLNPAKVNCAGKLRLVLNACACPIVRAPSIRHVPPAARDGVKSPAREYHLNGGTRDLPGQVYRLSSHSRKARPSSSPAGPWCLLRFKVELPGRTFNNHLVKRALDFGKGFQGVLLYRGIVAQLLRRDSLENILCAAHQLRKFNVIQKVPLVECVDELLNVAKYGVAKNFRLRSRLRRQALRGVSNQFLKANPER